MLKNKLQDPSSAVLLYGTTPPRAGTADAQVHGAADKLAARLAPLPLDGVVVYDIQDESGRTALPRPFAFSGTVDPCRYGALLAARTRKPTIAYKCVGNLDEVFTTLTGHAEVREGRFANVRRDRRIARRLG